MKEMKRLTLLCGHYGSGKTNVAVNLALQVKKERDRVAIADLDIVNPYFRAKDSSDDFDAAGIRLICSAYANTNVDIPSLPPDLYVITNDKDLSVIIDVGGDERGALALGRLVPEIKEENNYDMWMVINCFRPLTPDAESTMEVLHEIEDACHLSFTGLVINSNIGEATTAEDVLQSMEYARRVSELSGLPVKFTAVKQELYDQLSEKIPDLFPLTLQAKPV